MWPAPVKRKLGRIGARAAQVMPIASVSSIAIGAQTSVHTPQPDNAPVSAVVAPASAAARRTCAGRRKSIRRLRIACGRAQNGTAR